MEYYGSSRGRGRGRGRGRASDSDYETASAASAAQALGLVEVTAAQQPGARARVSTTDTTAEPRWAPPLPPPMDEAEPSKARAAGDALRAHAATLQRRQALLGIRSDRINDIQARGGARARCLAALAPASPGPRYS